MMVVGFYCLVSQADSTTLDHGIGELSVAGKMEISKNKLILMDEWIFLGDRFLHLDNHLSLAIHTLDVGQDPGSYLLILFISKATVLTSGMLHHHFVSMSNEFSYTSRSHSYTILIILDFFWNTYLHDVMFLKVIHHFNGIKIVKKSIGCIVCIEDLTYLSCLVKIRT